MAITTAIGWTRSTFNGWRGCEKVGPGCDGCYAEAYDQRFFAGKHWGPDHARLLAGDDYWRQPYLWNRKAPTSEFAGRKGFWPVFAIAHGDVFDKHVPAEWRERLFRTMKETPNLTWQIVTKRIGNAEKMLPADWGAGYPNVWLLITVVNQEEADRDIPKLIRLPAPLCGLSIEPQLGDVDVCAWVNSLGWVITGGESKQRGHEPRDYDIAWTRRLIMDCMLSRVPIYVKQLGSKPVHSVFGNPQPLFFEDSRGADPSEWPADLRIQQFPGAA
jgi:protein gp37